MLLITALLAHSPCQIFSFYLELLHITHYLLPITHLGITLHNTYLVSLVNYNIFTLLTIFEGYELFFFFFNI